MESAFKILKATDWAMIVPVEEKNSGSTRSSHDIVKPNSVKLSPYDPSSIVLQFPAGSLAKGVCHYLELGGFNPLAENIDFDHEKL